MRDEVLTERLHQKIEEEPGALGRALREMVAVQEERDNRYGGKPIRTTPDPFFITREGADAFTRKVLALADLMERGARWLLEEGELAARLGMSEEHLSLLEGDLDRRGPIIPLARLDGMFLEDGRFQICEVNTDGSTGLHDAFSLGEAFRRTALAGEVAGEATLTPADLYAALAGAIRATWAARGGRGAPRVALVDWEDVKTHHEQEALCRELTAAGIPTERVDPRALTLREGALHAPGGPVDLVYKRVLTAELLRDAAAVADYLEAYRQGLVAQLDPFAADIIYDKGFLALLQEPETSAWMDADERALVAEMIPFTRLFPGDPELRARAEAEREVLVLKPRTEYGGKGVVLGPHVDQERWCRALDEAERTGSHLLQRYLPPPRQDVRVVEGEGVRVETLWSILGAWVFLGRFEGFYLRAGPDPVINVSSGAFCMPVLFVDR